MEEVKFPVKILDELYVHGIISSTENRRKEFLRLDFIEQIDLLFSSNPLARKVRPSGSNFTFYTSTFGDFVVSPSKNMYSAEQNEELAFEESKMLFSRLKEAYMEMDSCSNKMKEFIYH